MGISAYIWLLTDSELKICFTDQLISYLLCHQPKFRSATIFDPVFDSSMEDLGHPVHIGPSIIKL